MGGKPWVSGPRNDYEKYWLRGLLIMPMSVDNIRCSTWTWENNIALSIVVGGNCYVLMMFPGGLLNHMRIKGEFDMAEKGSDAKLYRDA